MKKILLPSSVLILFCMLGILTYVKINRLSYPSRSECNDQFIPLMLLMLIITGSVAILAFGIVPVVHLIRKKENITTNTEAELIKSQTDKSVVATPQEDVFEKFVAKAESIKNSSLPEQEKTDKLLWALCSLFNISQAMLYIKNNDSEALQLASTYAVVKDESTMKAVHPGEGLTGEVYAEKLPMLIKNIPPDYFKIYSGLGQALPVMLYIYPCIVEDSVKAIFEVSTFENWDKTMIEQIEKSCQCIVSLLK
ncbi:MAG: GAF domain-containing protein [Cytophagaceae bacterium]|nr:GAF domain-containing protein [Cytophagaceae bacterium]MDW8456201.1 GAF domain-containing protein [Cytophagaceae bacterium]